MMQSTSSSEMDRIYLNTPGAVEISDSRLGRKIRVEKQASLSTVVWNPWGAKAQQMPDFGNEGIRANGLRRIWQCRLEPD